jgi:hypothetical protein
MGAEMLGERVAVQHYIASGGQPGVETLQEREITLNKVKGRRCQDVVFAEKNC